MRLALPWRIDGWFLTRLQQRLVKTGAGGGWQDLPAIIGCSRRRVI